MQLTRVLQFLFYSSLWFSAASVNLSFASEEPVDKLLTRIAFGSCAMQQLEQPIWDTILASNPDLFLSLGDAIYGDWDGKQIVPTTQESLRRDWQMLAQKPGFQRLRKQIPMLATWDNHDYGSHDGGSEFALKESSEEEFLNFWGDPVDSPRRKRPGVYTSKIFGPKGRRVQVILLDTRYFKSMPVKDTRSKEEKTALNIAGKYLPDRSASASLLGEAQWLWLEQQLTKPAELRLIGSSTQIVADEKGHDEWGNYPLERQHLFHVLERTQAEGVILLSGNMHFSEISRQADFIYPLLDFTSSGLTHVNDKYPKMRNSRRVAGPFVELNFGLVEIDWHAMPSPTVSLQAAGLDGKAAFIEELSLGQLRFQ